MHGDNSLFFLELLLLTCLHHGHLVDFDRKTQDKFLKAPQKDTGSNNAGTPAPRSVPVTSAKTAGLARKEKNKLKVQHAEVSSTSGGVEELIQHFKKRTQHSHLMIKPGDIWRDDQVVLILLLFIYLFASVIVSFS